LSLIGLNSGVLVGSGGLVCTPSDSGQWNGSTGNFAFSGDDIYGGHGTNAAIRTTPSLVGDLEVHWNWVSGGAESVIGLMPVSSDGSFNSAASHAGMAGSSWWLYLWSGSIGFWNPSNGSASWGSQGATVTHDPTGETMLLSRVGGVVSLFGDDALIHEWADNGAPECRIVIGYGNSGAATDWDNFIFCQ
jgi:hypothetical protein